MNPPTTPWGGGGLAGLLLGCQFLTSKKKTRRFKGETPLWGRSAQPPSLPRRRRGTPPPWVANLSGFRPPA